MLNVTRAKQRVTEWESYVGAQRARRADLDNRLKEIRKALADGRRQSKEMEQARNILVTATAATQDQVRAFIEETVTLALQSVFGSDYVFSLDIRSKRGQSEMEPLILWQGDKFSPRSDVGGGVIDIVSFALRLTLWALQSERTAPVLLLDEPFKFLSKDKTAAAAAMLKGLGEMLGIQILMVSHDAGLIEAADRAWQVRRSNEGIAEVSELVLSPESE